MESVLESNEFWLSRDCLNEEREVALRIDKDSAFQSRGAHTLTARRPIDRRAVREQVVFRGSFSDGTKCYMSLEPELNQCLENP